MNEISSRRSVKGITVLLLFLASSFAGALFLMQFSRFRQFAAFKTNLYFFWNVDYSFCNNDRTFFGLNLNLQYIHIDSFTCSTQQTTMALEI